jgi:aminoglycoside 6'-N-acetyltransferase
MSPDRYKYRPFAASDLPLVRRWLEAPHVAEWWGDVDSEIAEREAVLTDPACEGFVVMLSDRPIGYIQAYDPHAEHDHPYADQPASTRGIDQMLGEADLLGRGHGTGFIRAFVERLFAAGVDCVVTDPDPANARAIHVYEKCGFRAVEERDTPFGRVLLMACEKDTSRTKQ